MKLLATHAAIDGFIFSTWLHWSAFIIAPSCPLLLGLCRGLIFELANGKKTLVGSDFTKVKSGCLAEKAVKSKEVEMLG